LVSSGRAVMPTHRRMPSDFVPAALPAVRMRSPAWVAMPDDDDDDAMEVTGLSQTGWWLVTCLAVVAFLLYGSAPWWLIAIVAAEVYASIRRVIFTFADKTSESSVTVSAAGASGRSQFRETGRTWRHFTSVQLVSDAPVDAIIASYLSLDRLDMVGSIEAGLNTSTEEQSRGHVLGLMASFVGCEEREMFLKSKERADFKAFVEPFVKEWFVFDFEGGAR
jgi:hypothetical protein